MNVRSGITIVIGLALSAQVATAVQERRMRVRL